MSAPGFAPVRPATPDLPYGATAPVAAEVDLRARVDPSVFVNAYTRPLPSYAETFSGPGYHSRPMRTSAAAVAALVCGILGALTAVPALAAIVLGHIGLVRTGRNTHQGRGLAMGGMILGYAVVTVVGLLLLASWITGL